MDFSDVGLATAFPAGVVSLLSPCVLPLVPGYVSSVAGRIISPDGLTGDARPKKAGRTLGLSVCFVLGFMARMMAMRRSGRVKKIAAGGIMVVMGVAMITGHLTSFAIWLLQTFSALGRIG